MPSAAQCLVACIRWCSLFIVVWQLFNLYMMLWLRLLVYVLLCSMIPHLSGMIAPWLWWHIIWMRMNAERKQKYAHQYQIESRHGDRGLVRVNTVQSARQSYNHHMPTKYENEVKPGRKNISALFRLVAARQPDLHFILRRAAGADSNDLWSFMVNSFSLTR